MSGGKNRGFGFKGACGFRGNRTLPIFGVRRCSAFWLCPKCGANISTFRCAIKRHKECCKGPKKAPRVPIKSVRLVTRGEYFLFYHNGMLHYLSMNKLAKYIGITHPTVKARLARDWTVNELLGVDPAPDDCKGGNHTKHNILGDNTEHDLSDKEKKIQDLMRKL